MVKSRDKSWLYIKMLRYIFVAMIFAFIVTYVSSIDNAYGATAGSSFSTAVQITAGRSTSGTLSGSNYYYKFTKDSGSCKVIISTGTGSKTATLYDENYSTIGSCSSSSSASAGTTKEFYLLGGTYYIKVSGASGGYSVSYTWQNTNETIPETQNQKYDTISNAASLSLGKLSTAQLGYNDSADAFTFNVPKDGTLTVSKFFVSGDKSVIKGQLYNSNGSAEGTSFSTANGPDDVYSVNISKGTHYVIFSGGQGKYYYKLTFAGQSASESEDEKVVIDLSAGTEVTYNGSQSRAIYTLLDGLASNNQVGLSEERVSESDHRMVFLFKYDLDNNRSWDISVRYTFTNEYYIPENDNTPSEARFNRLSTCSINNIAFLKYIYNSAEREFILQYMDGIEYLYDEITFYFNGDFIAAAAEANALLSFAYIKDATVNESEYTTDSYKVFSDAKAALETLLTSDKSTVEQINAAIKALNDAYVNLKTKAEAEKEAKEKAELDALTKTKKNTMIAKAAKNKIVIKVSKVKKKAITIKRKKAIKVRKHKGKVSYKLSTVKKAKFKKYFKVAKKTGHITIRKGLKKGIYIIKIKVTAVGNETYKPLTKTVKLKIVVK